MDAHIPFLNLPVVSENRPNGRYTDIVNFSSVQLFFRCEQGFTQRGQIYREICIM